VSRRRILALGAAALPAGLLLARSGAAQGFSQAPLAPDDARGDLEHRFWKDLMDEFPLEPGEYPFDHAESGIPPLQTLQRMDRVARDVAGHPADPPGDHVDNARQAVARFVGAEPEEIALMRDATEAMSVVADALPLEVGARVALSEHEPASTLTPWLTLAREGRIQLGLFTPLPADSNLMRRIRDAADDAAAIVLSHVLPTNGEILPLAEVVRNARRRGALVIVNGSYGAGIRPLDLRELGADVYVASGSGWLLGPPGTAFAYVRRELLGRLRPRYRRAVRASVSPESPVTVGIDAASRLELEPRSPSEAAGLAASLEWLDGIGVDVVREHATALATRLREGIASIDGVDVLSSVESVQRVPIVTFRVSRRPSTQVADWLLERMRMRVHRVEAVPWNAVRVSTHLVNRYPDIDWLVDAVRALA
jgi:selenocysteine lyase/cysteine desulfurase